LPVSEGFSDANRREFGLSYQIQLVGLALLLYVYDSTLLLYANEAVLTEVSPARWAVTTGWQEAGVGGRLLCILSLLAPQRPTFRLAWDYHSPLESASSISQDWSVYGEQLRFLSAVGPVVGIGLFVVLPIGLFTAASWYAVVLALAMIYGASITGLVLLFRKRVAAGLTGGRFAALASECLLCPPLAVNITRRITLASTVIESLPLAGARLLPKEEWQRLRNYCLGLLDGAIQATEEGSTEAESLAAQKRLLQDMV
jgi:hypothetical protein